MKKRLLSAALALAMVLTLLPATALPAFAASPANSSEPESGKTQVKYNDKYDYTVKVEGGGALAPGWAWQYKVGNDTYWTSQPSLSGVVVGTGASGVWYADTDIHKIDSDNLVNNNLTLTGNVTVSNVGNATSLSFNLFGNSLTLNASLLKVTSLTFTDTYATTYGKDPGTVSTITRDVANYTNGDTTKSTSGLTVRATGVKIGNISLEGRGNNVTLTGVEVTGGITMDGSTHVTDAKGNVAHSYPAQTLTIQSQNANAGYGVGVLTPSVGGAISVIGNGSNVSLSDVKGSGSVTVKSTGGNVKVDGVSVLGAVKVGCGPEAVNTSTPAALTINSGKVTSVDREDFKANSTNAGSITVNQNGEVTGAITTAIGNVTVNSGHTGNINVTQGTVSISGTSARVGDLSLGNKSVTLNVTGTGHVVGDITNTGTLTIGNNWPTGRTNTFGTLNLSSGYTGQGIKGGIFKTAADDSTKAKWFSGDLQFMRKFTSGIDTLYAYYGKRELSDAIADAGIAAKAAGTIDVMGSKADKVVSFYNSTLDIQGNNPVAVLRYHDTTAIYLPDKINGTPVVTWTNVDEAKTYSVNEQASLNEVVPTNTIKLVLQSSGAAVTKLTNAEIVDATPGEIDKNVTVTLSGSQVTLSGAVSDRPYANIVVRFTTDLIDYEGKPVTFTVPVAYDTTNKTATFSTLGLDVPTGVTVNNNNIVVGSNTYNLSTSGLAKPASNLRVDYTSKAIVVTVNGNMTPAAKQELINKISASPAAFGWEDSPAVRQALNAAMATITASSQVDNWATAAQRAAWNLVNKGTPTADNLSSTGFNDVVLVPYLAVNVTAYNANGTLTATLTPSYRVEVRSSVAVPINYKEIFKNRTNGTADGSYLAQAGRPMGALLTDLTGGGTETGVELTFNTTEFNNSYAVQDDTYVYWIGGDQKATITHAGKSGLGTIVIGKTNPLMALDTTDADGNGEIRYYNNLQAAVDEAKNGDTLTVYSAYTGSGVINVTGAARKFTIVTEGNTTITPANNNFTVKVDPTGHTYEVQLQKNVTPVGGNITVTDVTGGTASVNVNPATVGQTVTITLRPNTGYVSNGVTVRTNATTGTASTTVPVTGSGNSYTFTMPAGSVTVTPAFRQGQTQTTATVTVSNSGGMGTTTTTAASTNNQATPGSVVGVYTTPASGYRTMSVNVSTNGSGTTAVRQGDNYFTFTVPSNATAVTVTPVYDRDNGTKFSDVWSTEYYSNPVAWAVSSGVTDGTSTYTFSPSNYCTRAQMVTFLWRAEGRPSVANIRNPFVDVSPTLTPGDYYSAILWAVSKGITDGKTPTRFAPNDIVTRGQAVTFLYRYENKPAAGTTSQFYDVPSSEYYARPVSWAANRAVPITTGKTNTMFDPNSAVTRAQAVTFLYRDKTNKLA